MELGRINIQLDNNQLNKFKIICKEQKISMSMVLRNLINKEIKKHDKNKN